ncbi:MAG: HEAT repeat domain-containing protein, partial [Pedosphaera parvula]|nr:HEAT repeat domain-containing protein [Pedosphaera parvula]
DATGNDNFFGPAFSGHLDYPAKHGGMRQFWIRPSRPCPGTGLLSSRHFPEEFQGNFLNCNVIGFQGIFRVKVTEEGSGLKGETLEDLVKSDDPNFRPSAVDVAPDGSIYFLDWAKPLIGHMQHHIRDPNRDKSHGRIYRITHEGRPLLKPVKIDGQPIAALLDALKEPEDNVRTRAKIELGKHDSAKVLAAVKKWIAKLDKNEKAHEHHMMEALWVHQWHNVVDEDLLKRMLRSPDHHARAAATRVLCYWRDRVKEPLALLEAQAQDDHPRVRLEAVRACSFFKTAKAAEVALAVLDKEKDPNKPDYYIKYCLDETMKQLDKYTK